MNLYRDEASNPKWNAQRNLSGRTHYVDDDTLRFHKSRIISVTITGGVDRRGGLLLALIESVAKDMHNTQRGFRFVVFDVFGTIVSREDLDGCVSTSEKARKEMWKFLNEFDPIAHTLDAIDQQEKQHASEMDQMRAEIRSLAQLKAA